jgi:hypothetical protein
VRRWWHLVALLAIAAQPAYAWLSVAEFGCIGVLSDCSWSARDVVQTPDGIVAVGTGGAPAVGVPIDVHEFVVVKLARGDGSELWRRDLGPGSAHAVVADAAGNPIAVGSVDGAFTVAKLSGADGSDIWRKTITGSEVGGVATAVALDPTGAVLVAGALTNLGTGADAAVVKLADADGGELWRYTNDGGNDIPYEGFRSDTALSVRSDPMGNAIVLSNVFLSGPGFYNVFASVITKLAGDSGMEDWRNEYQDDGFHIRRFSAVTAIVVDAAGFVVAEGNAPASNGPPGFPPPPVASTFMLSGVDGRELWRRASAPASVPVSVRLGLLASGDVVAIDPSFTVVALAHGDGHELWTRALGCGLDDQVEAMTVDAAGDVVIAGNTRDCIDPIPPSRFTEAKLHGSDGVPRWRRDYDKEQPRRYLTVTAMAAGLGDVVAVGALAQSLDYSRLQSTSFVALDVSGDSGAALVCGDGYVDAPEVCDDGETFDIGCCSARCDVAATDGTACSDQSACTTADTCRGGACVGAPLPCEPCGTCDPIHGCVPNAPPQCRTPTASEKAVIRIDTHAADGLSWEWVSGARTDKVDFGDPRSDTSYALCVYADSNPSVPIVRAAIPAGSKCSRKTGCWRKTRRGFKYRSRSGGPDGVDAVALEAGPFGRARIAVRAHGHHLGLPPLPLLEAVTVRLQKVDGSDPCWDAQHHDVVKSTNRRFVARGE